MALGDGLPVALATTLGDALTVAVLLAVALSVALIDALADGMQKSWQSVLVDRQLQMSGQKSPPQLLVQTAAVRVSARAPRARRAGPSEGEAHE